MELYEIAGLRVAMEVSGRTRKQAQPYRIPEGAPQVTVTCDIPRLRTLNPWLENDDDAQYLGTEVAFARELLAFDGFRLHASAVCLEGKAYLFSANSGVGKSTQAQRWCRLFGARYLNDDKPALRLTEGGWMAYGTPWSGKQDLSSPEGIPLGGIALLTRGENRIRRLDPAEAVPGLIAQCPRYFPKEAMGRQLELLDGLLGRVPVWHLQCENNDESALMARTAMTGVGE